MSGSRERLNPFGTTTSTWLDGHTLMITLLALVLSRRLYPTLGPDICISRLVFLTISTQVVSTIRRFENRVIELELIAGWHLRCTRIIYTQKVAVYVDTLEEKAIVGIQPKPAFLPLFEVAAAGEDRDVALFSGPSVVLGVGYS